MQALSLLNVDLFQNDNLRQERIVVFLGGEVYKLFRVVESFFRFVEKLYFFRQGTGFTRKLGGLLPQRILPEAPLICSAVFPVSEVLSYSFS